MPSARYILELYVARFARSTANLLFPDFFSKSKFLAWIFFEFPAYRLWLNGKNFVHSHRGCLRHPIYSRCTWLASLAQLQICFSQIFFLNQNYWHEIFHKFDLFQAKPEKQLPISHKSLVQMTTFLIIHGKFSWCRTLSWFPTKMY